MGRSVMITMTTCLLLARIPRISTRYSREATDLYSILSLLFVGRHSIVSWIMLFIILIYHKHLLSITNITPIYNSSSAFGASFTASSGFSDLNASSTLLRMRKAPFFSFDTLSLPRNFWILAFSESR